jgi:Transcription elongation factor, N-terminal
MPWSAGSTTNTSESRFLAHTTGQMQTSGALVTDVFTRVTHTAFIAIFGRRLDVKLMNRFPITAAGHEALEDELRRRIRVERPRLIQRIQEAIADDSNLAENSEYQAAKADQEFNEARELREKIRSQRLRAAKNECRA